MLDALPTVRPAKPEDAVAAVELLRAAITRLCVQDHGNEPANLEAWLRDKTVDAFLRWLDNAEHRVLVAEHAGSIAGVAAFRARGELWLCYVHPERQRLGIGGALLRVIEAEAKRSGIRKMTLRSTAGARSFYEHFGYAPAAPACVAFGTLTCYPYEKSLT